MDTQTDKINSWKALADILIKENLRAYVKDVNDEYYFGHLLYSGEDKLEIECFAPANKNSKKFILRWIMINKFAEYMEEM